MRKEVIGNCTLYQGDCRDVMPTLGTFDCLLTDPPYGIAKKLQGGQKNAPNFKKLLTEKINDWDLTTQQKLVNVAIDKCDISIVWGGNYYSFPPSRMYLVWDKGNTMRGRSFAECEMAWVSMDGNARVFTYAPPVFTGQEPQKVHPTQKPIALMKWCLSFVPAAETILDPFMGSGTTAVACVAAGKSFTGIELDATYFDHACRRVEDAYRQADLFIPAPINAPLTQSVLL